MKKTALIFCFFLYSINGKSQWINSLTLLPTNPTSNSQISLVADMYFSSAPCNDHTQFLSLNNTTFTASALHCLGMLTVICNYTDTFTLGQLAAGTYHFVFNVNAGGGPSPCSPGIVPGPTDSLTFTVSAATSITEVKNTSLKLNFTALQKSIAVISENPNLKASIQFLNAAGKILFEEQITHDHTAIPLDFLRPGFYFVRLQTENEVLIKKFVLAE